MDQKLGEKIDDIPGANKIYKCLVTENIKIYGTSWLKRGGTILIAKFSCIEQNAHDE